MPRRETDDLLRGTALLARARLALAVPVVHAMGTELLEPVDPPAGVTLVVAGPALNGAGSMHSSAMAAALECAAYLALLPHLTEAEHALTHTVTVSLLAAVPQGARVEARGEVDRRTRRLAHVGALARVDGVAVARAQLVKSVVALG